MVLFFSVFLGACLLDLLCFRVPEDFILAFFLAHFERDLEKTFERIVSVVNFRGLTFSRWSPFASLGCGCVSMMDFSRSV